MEAKEWLNKLDMDLEEINKMAPNNQAKPNKKTSSKEKIHNIDKSLEKIEKQVNLLNKTAKDTNYKTKSLKKSRTSTSPGQRTGPWTKVEEKKERKKTPDKYKATIDTKSTIGSERFNKISFENLKKLNDEIDHIKEFCKDLKSTVESTCLVDNEKKSFNKMKNDFIKQNADINIMKEDMGEMMKNLHFLMRRVDVLEDENKNLRRHNQNLVKFVKNIGQNDRGIQSNIHIIEVRI